jgi:hypothetical protein
MDQLTIKARKQQSDLLANLLHDIEMYKSETRGEEIIQARWEVVKNRLDMFRIASEFVGSLDGIDKAFDSLDKKDLTAKKI